MSKRPFEGVEYQPAANTIELGCILQRLFSTFPNSWPGVGLLLLRVCLGIALIYFGMTGLSGKPSESNTLAQNLIPSIGSIFLLAGLWTPVVGTGIALHEVWIALSLYAPRREDTWIHIFLGVLSVSLAMLGPGAWSIDARLFGRKRFDIDRTRGRRPYP
jgi:putative oxidoreductase